MHHLGRTSKLLVQSLTLLRAFLLCALLLGGQFGLLTNLATAQGSSSISGRNVHRIKAVNAGPLTGLTQKVHVLTKTKKTHNVINNHAVKPDTSTKRHAPMQGSDLGITSSADAASYTVGQTVTYTLTVTNGASADPILLGIPITVTDLAALGLSNVATSASSGWSFTNTSTTSPSLITAAYTGAYPIMAGESLPAITVTGTANGDALGIVANVATVSIVGDLNLANNSATVDVNISNAVTPTPSPTTSPTSSPTPSPTTSPPHSR